MPHIISFLYYVFRIDFWSLTLIKFFNVADSDTKTEYLNTSLKQLKYEQTIVNLWQSFFLFSGYFNISQNLTQLINTALSSPEIGLSKNRSQTSIFLSFTSEITCILPHQSVYICDVACCARWNILLSRSRKYRYNGFQLQ